MTPSRELRNVPASVHQRLLNLARDKGSDFNVLLQRYAGERFLYRLGVSAEVDRFTLKGAALFLVWTGAQFRVTRDVDLLCTGAEDHPAIRTAFEAICMVHCTEDGVFFDPATIRIDDIRDEHEYRGVRIRLRAKLGNASLPLQVDLGFGDVITPERSEARYPTLLDHPAPRVWTYPRETVVAEKFEAMVRLGLANSRMKDFWDVAMLAQRFSFDGETLSAAVGETLRRRGTSLGAEPPEALRPGFYDDATRGRQWGTFLGKISGATGKPVRFEAAGDQIRAFLGPIRGSLVLEEPFTQVWPMGGPWQAAGPRMAEGDA